jgi:hypothetical protein
VDREDPRRARGTRASAVERGRAGGKDPSNVYQYRLAAALYGPSCYICSVYRQLFGCARVRSLTWMWCRYMFVAFSDLDVL